MTPHSAGRFVTAWALSTILVAATGTSGQGERSNPAGDVGALAWLEGTWMSASGPATIEERWTPAAGGAMLGTSRTIRGDRMVAFEFLRIVARQGALYYIAQPGGRPPIEFRMTGGDAASAVFENPQHDHPKIIRYRRAGDTLTAEIEGDENGRRVHATFTFRRTAASK